MCTSIIFYNTYGFADFEGSFLMFSYLKTRTIHVDNTGTASKLLRLFFLKFRFISPGDIYRLLE